MYLIFMVSIGSHKATSKGLSDLNSFLGSEGKILAVGRPSYAPSSLRGLIGNDDTTSSNLSNLHLHGLFDNHGEICTVRRVYMPMSFGKLIGSEEASSSCF
jgi:hypothetical protein